MEATVVKIIENGKPTVHIQDYEEEDHWVKIWNSNAPSFTFQTSGTTGPPKQIQFSREQVVKSALRTWKTFQLPQTRARCLHALPMSFVAGKMNILRGIIHHADVYAMAPGNLQNWEDGEAMDWLTCTPLQLLNALENGKSFHSVKQILLGGSPLPRVSLEVWRRFPGQLWEGYGATETLTHVAVRDAKSTSPYFHFLDGVRGQSTDNETLRIWDEALNNDVTTQDVIDWEESGGFKWRGRLDRVINSGGVKIFPEEIENAYARFIPNAVHVIAVESKLYGFRPQLWVESEHEIKIPDWDQIRGELPHLWKPDSVHFSIQFKRTASGKIIAPI